MMFVRDSRGKLVRAPIEQQVAGLSGCSCMKCAPCERAMDYIDWRDHPRKWISISTWSGGHFVVEDK